MATPITILPATFIKVNSFLYGNTKILCGIRLGSEAVGEVYKVVNNIPALLFQSTGLGKDDSITAIVRANGTMEVDVSEADVSGSGTTSAVRTYIVPNALPALPTTPATTSVDTALRAALKTALTGIQAYLTNLLKVL